MQRYFALNIDSHIVLSKEDEHHLLNVMRARIGEEIEVVFNQSVYLCSINSIKPLELKIVKENPFDSEIKGDITLLFSLAKGDKIDFVVQKATELGVKKIALIKTKYCISKFDDKDVEKKLIRFNKIAKEAAMQSKRNIIPEVVGVYDIYSLPSNLLKDINLVAYECDKGNTSSLYQIINNNINQSVSILIGPEGGLAKEEIEHLVNNNDFKRVSLGKRILRTETAAIYALSVIGFLKEQL